jgi:hypothetical protein
MMWQNKFILFLVWLMFALNLCGSEVVKHEAYTVSYNTVTNCPDYVAYILQDFDILANHPRFSMLSSKSYSIPKRTAPGRTSSRTSRCPARIQRII